MPKTSTLQNGAVRHWVAVREGPAGQFTAQAVGLPEICATAGTRAEALERLHGILENSLASGQLVSMELQVDGSIVRSAGPTDPNDPEEQAFLAELARSKQEDLQNTLRELDQECCNSSSTPTT